MTPRTLKMCQVPPLAVLHQPPPRAPTPLILAGPYIESVVVQVSGRGARHGLPGGVRGTPVCANIT